MARHPAVLEFFRKRVDAALKDVAGYEQVKKFIVLARPFTVAGDELTVSLKTAPRGDLREVPRGVGGAVSGVIRTSPKRFSASRGSHVNPRSRFGLRYSIC